MKQPKSTKLNKHSKQRKTPDCAYTHLCVSVLFSNDFSLMYHCFRCCTRVEKVQRRWLTLWYYTILTFHVLFQHWNWKRLTIHICGAVQCALLSSIRLLSSHSWRKIKMMNHKFTRFLKQSVLLHKPERRPLYNIFILTFIQAY